MAKKNNKTCILCGKVYTYCPSCLEFKDLPRWMSLFDKDNCHDIFNIVSSYNQEAISIEDARAMIRKKDLSEMGLYAQHVQDSINQILGKSIHQQENKTVTATPIKADTENRKSIKNAVSENPAKG